SAPALGLRSISARFCPYWPNNRDASRLSSKASTTWVAELPPPVGEDTNDPLSDRDERNGSGLHQHRFRVDAGVNARTEQAIGADVGTRHRRDVAHHCRWGHGLKRLEVWGAADNLARMASRLVEQDVEGAAEASGIEGSLVAVGGRLQAVEPLGCHGVRYLIRQVRGRRSGTRR